MKYRIFFFLVLLLGSSRFVPILAQDGDLSEAILAERRAIAESGQANFIDTAQLAAAPSALSLGRAMDVSALVLLDATVTGPAQASAIFNSLGVIKPRQGTNFALLSSGIAGTKSPERGTDFSPTGQSGDYFALTLTLNIPQNVNFVSFEYNFLSAEFPDFIGSAYNDTFRAVVTDANGTREVARSSVNTSVFFPASSERAGGSGFDIFTASPSGVDTVFGSGLPDAGLTDFQRVSFAVAGGNSVQLTFSIQDLSDGILDSAVILDNLAISAIEIVDPQPYLINSTDGSLLMPTSPDNLTELAVAGQPRKAAAADGVTRMLLRTRLPGPGTVEFCMVGNATQDGGLGKLGENNRSGCVYPEIIQYGQGYIAFAVYRTPDEFNRGQDTNLRERDIRFRMTYYPLNGQSTVLEQTFKLTRPPLVLVHGLWSDPSTWTFRLANDARFIISKVDYEASNARSFSYNVSAVYSLVSGGIEAAISKAHNEGIAVTQVDVIGHSMGGILTRLYAADPAYKRWDNYNAGDIRKIITINTPHTGSPLADILVDLQDSEWAVYTFDELLEKPITQGAIDDLAKGSAAINAIPQTNIPSHALVGIGGSELIGDASELVEFSGWVGVVWKIISFFLTDITDAIPDLQHDAVVGRLSQEGGLPSSATTVFDGYDSIHTSATGSNAYSNRIIQLLDRPANTSAFAFFPAPSILPQAAGISSSIVPTIQANVIEAAANPGLTITSPINNTIVRPGSIVNVVVQPYTGINMASVMLITPTDVLIDNTAPFQFSLTIPSTIAGNFDINAIGKSDSNNFYSSNTIRLRVNTTATLRSLEIAPDEIFFGTVGEQVQLTVMGQFSDNVKREITSSTTGTTYLSSNTAVATVSAQGLVSAVGRGIATIVAKNGNLQASINVQFTIDNIRPIANAGLDRLVKVGTQVILNGGGSSDGDSGPQALSYEWFQVAGPTVTLSSPTTVSPQFYASQTGRYSFSLIVRDGAADSIPDNVTIVVTSTGIIPSAPLLTSPGNNTSTSNTQPTFQWPAVANAIGYEFQLGRSNPPVTPIIQTLTNSFKPSVPLLSGVYYTWRVRAIIAEGVYTNWSLTSTFLLESLPDEAPRIHYFAGSQAVVTWDALTWAAGYEIEISNDPVFSNISDSGTTDAATLRFTTLNLPSGIYYWHVRGLDENQVPGSWSDSEQFSIDAP